jgi:hypothetical protein
MIDDFLGSMLTLERWPWWSAALVLTIIGQFTSTKLFTRERAYRNWGAKWKHHFWFWMRETLMLHPIAAGFTLGFVWRDPEGQGWPLIGSQMYFASAGCVALVGWIIIKAVAKNRGVELKLPGESTVPPQPAPTPAASSGGDRHPLKRR